MKERKLTKKTGNEKKKSASKTGNERKKPTKLEMKVTM